MYEFHGNKQRYFDMTHQVTVGHIIPFLQSNWTFPSDMTVLEIGCGEAGVLKAFTDLGYRCTGIELEENRLEFAREFMKAELDKGVVQFLNKDIYDVIPETDLGTRFDLIILKDVIEHIPDQARFMPQLERFLKPGGSYLKYVGRIATKELLTLTSIPTVFEEIALGRRVFRLPGWCSGLGGRG